jgi:hypothetical protein
MRIIFIVTIVTFIGGIFMGFGTYLFGSKEDFKTVATVNSTKIPMRLFNSIYINSSEMYRQITNNQLTEKDLNEIKVKTIQVLVQDEIFYQQSKLYNIIVTDEELKIDLQNSALFRNNNIFDIQKYYSFLKSIQMTPKEYETLRKKQIAGNKVKMILAPSIKLWNYELEAAIRQNPSITKNALLQAKINIVLNEWYLSIIKNSKITSNEMIFK